MKKVLYWVWAGLFVVCAGLGAIGQRSQAGQAALTVLSVLFFLPAFWLLVLAVKQNDRRQLRYLRIISISSLALTTLALVLNIMSMQASVVLGNVLYVILLTVSVPMFCCGFWALSLFLWAVLFMSTFPKVLGGLLKKP